MKISVEITVGSGAKARKSRIDAADVDKTTINAFKWAVAEKIEQAVYGDVLPPMNQSLSRAYR